MAFNRTIGMLSGDPRVAMADQGMSRGERLGSMFGGAVSQAMGRDMRTPEQLKQASISQAMSSVDMSDPEALLKMAEALRTVDPATSVKLLGAYKEAKLKERKYDQDYLASLATAGAGKGFSTSEGNLVRDSKGNKYQTMLRTDRTTGSVETVYLPVGGAPPFDPNEQVTILSGTTGLTPVEAEQLKAETAANVAGEQEYRKLRVAALDSYPEAVGQSQKLDRLLSVIDAANEQGDLKGGIGQNLRNEWYRLTNTMPETLADLNNSFGTVTYSFLRQLFGSQITEGERKAVEDIFLGINKSGVVNKAVIANLKRNSQSALRKLEMYRNSKTLEEYNRNLDVYMEEAIKKPTKRFNPETGRIELI